MTKNYFYYLLLFTLFSLTSVFSQKEPTDCINAIIVCGNTNLELNSNGVGIDDFASANNNSPSCFFFESQSLWVRINIVQSGTLAFTITPESSSRAEDYDFAIYGPNVDCSNLGSSIRCSSTNPPSAGVSTLTGLNDSETDLNEGPGPDGNGFVRSIDAIAGEEYIVLIDNFSQNGGFNLEFTGTAVLPDNPADASGKPLDITECDITGDSSDGVTYFDLESNTSLVLNGQTNTSVSYHATEQDASIDINHLSSPYLSTQNNQNIYTRIQNNSTGCFVVDTFRLISVSGPHIDTSIPFMVCDNDDDGDDTNGRASFILADKETEILNGISPTDVIITYYLSQTDADQDLNPIDKNIPYTNVSNPQNIFVKARDINNRTCTSIRSYDLIVNKLPVANSSTLTQCDFDNNSNDGITFFNLTQSENEIIGGASDVSISFFETESDAIVNTAAITNVKNYQNSQMNQQIFARVTDNNYQCFRITHLTLNVSSTSTENISLRNCDLDGIDDGFTNFNLAFARDQISSTLNNASASIRFYKTVDQALSETDEISSIINSTMNTQGDDVVYARVENNSNQCHALGQVFLFLDELPELGEDTEMFLCLGQSITLDTGITNSTNTNNYQYEWSTGATTSSIEIDLPDDYFVTVTQEKSNCSETRFISVNFSESATITDIQIVDGIYNNQVTITATGLGNYEYALVREGIQIPTYQNSNIFRNITPDFYTVYVRDQNGCLPITTRQISVIGFPQYFTPNGDHYHPTWNIQGISEQLLTGSEIFIFDRSGTMIKKLFPGESGWDGTYNGRQMPSSEYWYVANLSDGRTLKGSFSLIR